MRGLSRAVEGSVVHRTPSRELTRDVVVVLGWFLVLGVLAAVLWWQVTPLAEFTRTTSNAQMDEEQLGRQVAADGWYLTIAAVGGLVSGITLLSLRRRDPVATVLLVAAGSLLAGWLMLRVGHWLGPSDPAAALRHARVGAKVPVPLAVQAHGVFWVWPVATLLGAVGVIWGTDEPRPPRPSGDESPAASAGGSSSDSADLSTAQGNVPDDGLGAGQAG
jgi:hypothetical protein